jgi:hypothetical protein
MSTAVPFHVAQDLLQALMQINQEQPQGGASLLAALSHPSRPELAMPDPVRRPADRRRELRG